MIARMDNEYMSQVAIEKEGLPRLADGLARVVHITNSGSAKAIAVSGLDYSRHGMLSSTARGWVNESLVEFGSEDLRFSSPGLKCVVMDIPFNELMVHDNIFISPGKVNPKYLVGVIGANQK
jgi:hypothetical protein